MAAKIDHIDCQILEELQRDSAQSQRALSDRVGLSQNACWRRLKALEASGVIKGHTVLLDRQKLHRGSLVLYRVVIGIKCGIEILLHTPERVISTGKLHINTDRRSLTS